MSQSRTQERYQKYLNEGKYKGDFPFDLNSLFNLSYSFDTLKQALEYLAFY